MSASVKRPLNRFAAPYIAGIFLLAFAVGCSFSPEAYGVIVWGGDILTLRPGTIVLIHDSHEMDNTVTISLPADSKKLQVAQGFIKQFETMKQARQFREKYKQYYTDFARAKLNGLSIRAQPRKESTRVYKLRKNELVKIILPQQRTMRVEGKTGRWYMVCTKDGYRGYSFGPYLQIGRKGAINRNSGPDKEAEELLQQLYSNTWRPAYMRQGIREGRINLERFDPKIGLFPLLEDQSLELCTFEVNKHYSMDTAKYLGNRRIEFEDGRLLIEFVSSSEILTEYEYRGKLMKDRFVILNVELEDKIAQEKKRRQKIYSTFRNDYGDYFVSTHYGTLRFLEDGLVVWKDRENVPRYVIPIDAGREGEISFDLYMAESLQQHYQGVFSMQFPLKERNTRTAFLYRSHNEGLQLVYVPEEVIENHVVQKEPGFSLVMFFRKDQ